MVKLIATDMDGTLLDSQKRFPEDLGYVLEKLEEKNVKFIVASGRQYYNLYNIFKKYDKDLMYISENGAMVVDENQDIIYMSELVSDDVEKAVKLARTIDKTGIIICGKKSAYTESHGEFFMQNANMYYDKLEVVDDVLDIIREGKDEICKIALFHDESSEKYLKHEFEDFEDKFLICVSSEYWIDFMNIGVNKGEAIKSIQEHLGISYDETMAFGDFLNDFEMMQSCKYSYAMENAHPKLKEVSNFIAKSNDENGVMDAIKDYFEIK